MGPLCPFASRYCNIACVLYSMQIKPFLYCNKYLCFCLKEDIISIWNKTASDQSTTARIRDTLRRVLNLPPNTIMEYKTHTDSIKSVIQHTQISMCIYTTIQKYYFKKLLLLISKDWLKVRVNIMLQKSDSIYNVTKDCCYK